MSYRVFFTCDIRDCRNDYPLEQISGGLSSKIPPGWLALRGGEGPVNFDVPPFFICDEHAKLFPKRTEDENKRNAK